jgi:FKBP-type peptidyl-prolyl cis-trans isomerase SlyD
MKEEIRPDYAVTVDYIMRTHLPDGSVKERPKETFEFIFGVEKQVPTLEKALAGARVGDKLTLNIPPSQLYGERDPNLIKEITKEGLIKQRIKEGHYYRQMKKGSLVSFKVLEVKPETVVADFNEPMAGISVSMDLEILGARAASKAEIDVAYESQVKRSIGCG